MMENEQCGNVKCMQILDTQSIIHTSSVQLLTCYRRMGRCTVFVNIVYNNESVMYLLVSLFD